MSTSNSVQRAVRLALMTSAAASAVISLPAWSADDTISEVIVTGSRIAQPNLTTTSPVTAVTASDIETQGVTRIEDMLSQLPQAFTTQNATVSNGSTGTATIDLRGLGSARTLVLVDGRRMPYGGVTSASAAPNLNMIPTPLVERVEVLTGGSSAVYGSDAVSGVVNFIMKKNFEGIQIDGQYGVYQHTNDFGGPGSPKLRDVIAARAATNPSQYKLPGKSGTDGDSREGSLIMGVNSEDGRGNLTAYVVYATNDAVLQANRDFSSCTLAAAPTTQFKCGGSGTNATGQFQAANGTFTVDGTSFRDYTTNDQYNFGPLNYFVRPDDRYSLGAIGHYELSEHADVYTQLMFTDDRTVAQIAPGGLFIGDTSTLNCDNPLMTLTQRGQIGCTPALIASGGTVPVYIGRRNVEGGGRQQDFHNNTFRGVLGVKGDIVTGWQYDASLQFSRTSVEQLTLNYFAKDRIALALDAVADPDHPGQTICRSVLNGTDPNCVPYNIFSAGGVTQAALNYVQAPGIQQGVIDQSVFVGAITGDLGTIGAKLPTATEPFQVALGVEQRHDKLDNTTDALQQNDLLSGAGGATIGISGATHVNDYFAELVAPLVQDKPFARQLGLDLAYRYSDYGAITTDTYKLSADWAPVEDVRFRASYQRAVRAPNIVELFTGHGLNLFDLDGGDPCGLAAPNPDATRTECINTGVPASVYDDATPTGRGRLDNSAGQYNRLQGGVTDLKPETSDTYSYGIVFTPTFAPGLSVTIDYFNIKIDDTISTHGGVNTLNACYTNNDAAACSRIHRTASGSLYLGDGNVEDLNVNIGSLETKGVDLSVAYTGLDIGAAGSLSFNLGGTYVDSLHVEPGPNIDGYDCKGKFGGRCAVPNGIPTPEWRHTARVSWTTPLNVDLSLAWRYIGKTEQLDAPAGRLDSKFSAESYFDIYGSWAMLDNTTFRLGINNVLDNDPQLNSNVGTTGNGNTYPQVYDSLGRFIFTGLNVKF